MNMGFVGAGKLGFSLGRYFADKGIPLAGYTARRFSAAREAAAFTGSKAFEQPEDLVRRSDCLVLAVPDDAIGEVWRALRQRDVSGKIFCHCSGSVSSEVFEGAQERGAGVCSLHPLMAIPDARHSHALLGEAVFALEGSPEARDALHHLITGLGNAVYILDKDQKARYHCAAVFVSNFSTALAYVGEQLFRACGLEDATDPLFQLMLQNARSVREYGVAHALTGPVERCDAHTINRHLACLCPEDRQLYARLSQKLAQLAAVKHPDRDYAPVRETLGGVIS